MKVEKLAKNWQMVQNCYPLSPGRHARGRRERAAVDRESAKAHEDARAPSWPVRVDARAGKSSERIGADRSKSEFTLHFDRH